MIAIYRGEDTDFAGAEPIKIKIDTALDLTGYTADILFGNVVKHYEAEEVASKTLGLSFTAEETSGFFPGRGFASVKVYDTEGRVAILKRFVIDVRFRNVDGIVDYVDVSSAINMLMRMHKKAEEVKTLIESDDTATVKEAINSILAILRQREEIIPITYMGECYHTAEGAATLRQLVMSMKTLEAIALDNNLSEESDMADIKSIVNRFVEAMK